jgi:hypothetical protein
LEISIEIKKSWPCTDHVGTDAFVRPAIAKPSWPNPSVGEQNTNINIGVDSCKPVKIPGEEGLKEFPSGRPLLVDPNHSPDFQ